MKDIENAEQRVGHDRTVIFGDFNMSPFEPEMVGAQGFHSVMDREIARAGSRKIQGKDYNFLYNPMWGAWETCLRADREPTSIAGVRP